MSAERIVDLFLRPTAAERIVDRFLQGAITDEKLNEILLKIRKGATSNLNWTQLSGVLAALEPGWKVEKIVGLVKAYGRIDKPDEADTFWRTVHDKAEVEAKHREMESHAVNTLPTSPKHGGLYVLDLGPIETTPGHPPHGSESWHFDAKPWVGHEGWRIVTPDGRTYDALPGRYEVGQMRDAFRSKSRAKIRISDTLVWLGKETDWLDQINKKLGMDAHEPAAQRTRDGTGSCPVCFQNVKAKPQMVLHGYKRPGTGQVHGNCEGQGYLPFEVSAEGTKAYLKDALEPSLDKTKNYVKDLKDGKIKTISSPGAWSSTVYTPESQEWDRVLKREVSSNESRIEYIEGMIGAYKRLIQHWKERPLPKEGERHIDWFTKGQKP